MKLKIKIGFFETRLVDLVLEADRVVLIDGNPQIILFSQLTQVLITSNAGQHPRLELIGSETSIEGSFLCDMDAEKFIELFNRTLPGRIQINFDLTDGRNYNES